MIHLLARHHGRHASMHGDPFAGSAGPVTEALAAFPEPWPADPGATAPYPDLFRVRPYVLTRPSMSREAVLVSKRAVIANSITRLTLPCDFCHREHYNAQAGSFGLLRRYARDAGWQRDQAGRWRCPRCVRANPATPRCVRANPANLPMLAREALLTFGERDAA